MRRTLLLALLPALVVGTACGSGGTPRSSPVASVASAPSVAASAPVATVTVTATSTSTAAATAPPTPATPPAPSATAAAAAPDQVVGAYFDAINSRDYAKAWALGGKNLGGSYASFAAGFSTTARDDVVITDVSGGTVGVRIAATQTDGSVKVFTGSYRVQDGVIVGAAVSEAGSAAASASSGATAHGVKPGAFCATAGALGTTSDGKLMVCVIKPGDDRLRWRQP